MWNSAGHPRVIAACPSPALAIIASRIFRGSLVSVALVWFRRDLRLQDNPALQAALDAGHVPVPVYIHAPHEEGDWAPGGASNAWLHRSPAARRWCCARATAKPSWSA
jgi:deoxyribodipyrimidine photo-lyase